MRERRQIHVKELLNLLFLAFGLDVHHTQCPQTIENRAPFKASFVDLLVLYRFLVIEYHLMMKYAWDETA